MCNRYFYILKLFRLPFYVEHKLDKALSDFAEVSSAGCLRSAAQVCAQPTHGTNGPVAGGVPVHAGLLWPFPAVLQDCAGHAAAYLQASRPKRDADFLTANG